MPQRGPSTFSCRNRNPPLFHATTGAVHFSMTQRGVHFSMPQQELSTFPCRNRGSPLSDLQKGVHPSPCHTHNKGHPFYKQNKALHFSVQQRGPLFFSMPQQRPFHSPCSSRCSSLLHFSARSLHFSIQVFFPYLQLGPFLHTTISALYFSTPQYGP
jgi:hypothetical protein